jgi:hypothetical protein
MKNTIDKRNMVEIKDRIKQDIFKELLNQQESWRILQSVDRPGLSLLADYLTWPIIHDCRLEVTYKRKRKKKLMERK